LPFLLSSIEASVSIHSLFYVYHIMLLIMSQGQLQKMGILAPKQQKSTTGPTKRRSAQLDFGQLAPLKPGGTVGFSSFRDQDLSSSRRNKSRKKSNGSAGGAMDEDSDEEDEDAELIGKMEDVDDKDMKTMLNPEDAKYQGELADGVGRIKVRVLSHTQKLSLTWI
jgi:hypothetical protein